MCESEHVARNDTNTFDLFARSRESLNERIDIDGEIADVAQLLVRLGFVRIKPEILVESTEMETLLTILDATVQPWLLSDLAATDRLIFERPPTERVESFDVRRREFGVRSPVLVDESVESDQTVLDAMIVEVEPALFLARLCRNNAREAIVLFVFGDGVHRLAG